MKINGWDRDQGVNLIGYGPPQIRGGIYVKGKENCTQTAVKTYILHVLVPGAYLLKPKLAPCDLILIPS